MLAGYSGIAPYAGRLAAHGRHTPLAILAHGCNDRNIDGFVRLPEIDPLRGIIGKARMGNYVRTLFITTAIQILICRKTLQPRFNLVGIFLARRDHVLEQLIFPGRDCGGPLHFGIINVFQKDVLDTVPHFYVLQVEFGSVRQLMRQDHLGSFHPCRSIKHHAVVEFHYITELLSITFPFNRQVKRFAFKIDRPCRIAIVLIEFHKGARLGIRGLDHFRETHEATALVHTIAIDVDFQGWKIVSMMIRTLKGHIDFAH